MRYRQNSISASCISDVAHIGQMGTIILRDGLIMEKNYLRMYRTSILCLLAKFFTPGHM